MIEFKPQNFGREGKMASQVPQCNESYQPAQNATDIYDNNKINNPKKFVKRVNQKQYRACPREVCGWRLEV
jgi:hypothetical protein